MTAAQARRTLLGRFAAVLELTETTAPPAAGHKPRKNLRVPADRVTVLYRRMATMLKAGIPLLPVLHFLQNSEEDERLAEGLEYVVAGVSSGRSLTECMGAPHLNGIFSPVALGLMALGEQTGALLAVVEKLADLTEDQMRLRRAAIAALTYPAVLTVGIMGMGLFFVLVLGPGDSGLFSLFGGKLPWPTRLLVDISTVLRNPLLMALGLGNLLGAVAWFRHLLRTNVGFRLGVHDWALRQPVLGTLIRKTVSASMLYVMACALQVGLPMLAALGLARKVCTNDRMLADLDQAIELVTQGSELSRALEEHAVFPKLVTSMIQMGQETGHLDQIMGSACRSYEEDVEMTLSNLARLAEPVLLGGAGLLSAFLALATFMPIIELVHKL